MILLLSFVLEAEPPFLLKLSILAFFSSSSGKGANLTLDERDEIDAFETLDALERHVQFEDANEDDERCRFTILGIGMVG